MNIDFSIWNALCQIVAEGRKNDIDEKQFEKTFCELLAGIGWTKLPFKELKEQVSIPFANTNGIIDIMLIRKGNSSPDVIIEMKKPNHKQKAKDLQQLCDYLKQQNCLYGLYVGEKFELYFYDINNKPTEKPGRVLSISYLDNCVEGQSVFDLLKRYTFDSKQLEKFCEEQLLLNDTAERITSPNGKAEILDMIIEKTNLHEVLAERLRNMLLVDVRIKDSYSSNSVVLDVESDQLEMEPQSIPPKTVALSTFQSDSRDHTRFSFDGHTFYPKSRFAWAMITKYIELHPLATLDEIRQIMPNRSSNNSTILTKAEWLSKNSDAQGRYLKKESEILKDANGVEFLVSTQWGYDAFYNKLVPLLNTVFHLKLYKQE